MVARCEKIGFATIKFLTFFVFQCESLFNFIIQLKVIQRLIDIYIEHKHQLLKATKMTNATNRDLTDYFEKLASFSDERFFILTLSKPLKIILWIMLAGSLIIGSIAKIIMYTHILKSRIKEQPINVLLFIEQVIHHMCNFFILFTICISLPLGISPGEIIDTYFCNIIQKEFICFLFFNAHILSVVYLAVDGLGIALIRLMYIKKGTWLKYTFGEIKLLCLTGIAIATGTMGLMSMFSSANKYKRSAYLLCMGHNQEFQVIIIHFKFSPIKQEFVICY